METTEQSPIEKKTIEQKSNVNDIIKLMNRVNETFTYEIYIPSLQKNVMFRQINTAQQKRLIKSIIDSPAYNTQFIFTLKKIIDENCVESINIDDLTILDKIIIAIKMRSYSIGNDFELSFDMPDGEKVTRIIKLNELLENKLESIKIEPRTISDSKGVFTIVCGLPTISDEYRLEDELRRNTITVEINNEKDLRETIGEVYVNELVKYIKQISIKEDDQITDIDLKKVDFKNRIKIIEQLPTSATQQIVTYINDITKEFEKIILIKETINGKELEQRFKIDASFFTRS